MSLVNSDSAVEVADEAIESASVSSGSSSSCHRDVPSLLSDAGTYSYAALISLTLHELFDNTWDLKFNQLTIKALLQHLNLPKQVGCVKRHEVILKNLWLKKIFLCRLNP